MLEDSPQRSIRTFLAGWKPNTWIWRLSRGLDGVERKPGPRETTMSPKVENLKAPNMFISTRICSDNDISFSSILPGRLLHVKCRTGHNSLDIVNIYQHPDHCTLTRRAPLEARGEVWTKLDHLLHRLPCRNLRVIAGDFNCPLKAPTHSAHCPSDMFDFVELVPKYSLGSVRAHDGAPTYVGPQGHSIIDHVLMPHSQMDGHCRRGRTLPDFPVASWRANRPPPYHFLGSYDLEMLVSQTSSTQHSAACLAAGPSCYVARSTSSVARAAG